MFILDIVEDIRDGMSVEEASIKYQTPSVYIKTVLVVYNELCPETKVLPEDYIGFLVSQRKNRRDMDADLSRPPKKIKNAVALIERLSFEMRYRVRIVFELSTACSTISKQDIATITGLNMGSVMYCFDIIEDCYRASRSYDLIKEIPIRTPLIPCEKKFVYVEGENGKKMLVNKSFKNVQPNYEKNP